MTIIFKQRQAVEDGSKTMTQRCAQHGDAGVIGEVVGFAGTHRFYDGVKHNGRKKWHNGQIQAAVPKMYQHAFGKVEILSIYLTNVQDMTEEDARAEGVASLAEYIELWDSINAKRKVFHMLTGKRVGVAWKDDPLVWRLRVKFLECESYGHDNKLIEAVPEHDGSTWHYYECRRCGEQSEQQHFPDIYAAIAER